MDEKNIGSGSGELHGFDSAVPKGEEGSEGYTVTPEGGFYSSTQGEDKGSAAEILEKYFTEDEQGQEAVEESVDFSRPAPSEPAYIPPVQQKPQDSKPRFSLATVVVSVLLSAVIGVIGGLGGAVFATRYLQQDTPAPDASGTGSTVNISVKDVDATVVEAVAEKVTPSVVGIRTTVSVNNFFGGTSESSGEGSGVIYTKDGYIITNYHVISNAIEYASRSSAIQVFLSSDADTGYDATVVGYNISCDLAVIKINAKNLPAITVGTSQGLKTGQFVAAVGNPGGLEFMGSVTYGIISGLNRIVADSGQGSSVELIQTDAAINPGNSGGALVNIKGELIGINSSKIVSESYEGMGFAIPMDTVKDICDRLIDKEYDPDPYLGITISEKYDPATLKKYNFPVGAVVYSVASGSPADEAGIKRGDIITKFNGTDISHYSVLSDVLAQCDPGQTVSVTIYRGGSEYTGKITIGSNNSQ